MIDKKGCDKEDPSYKSCMRVFSKDVAPNPSAVVAPRKHTMANRIKQYYYLGDKLSLLREDDCLEKTKNADGTTGYTIHNIITLRKRIGSKSRYGQIYLTSIPSLTKVYPIATKVMPDNMNNRYEINIMLMITTDILLKNLSRHFLMIYGGCVCSKQIAKKLKLISINELADGDIKMLINIPEDVGNTELMFNLFIQTFISIATFHNLVGYVHRDTHYGNFLYQTNSEKGYYHYVFQGTSYYLKACKYNIIIYDYGFARRIETYDRNRDSTYAIDSSTQDIGNSDISKCKIAIYRDYAKIINAFIKRGSKSKGWNKLPELDKNLSDKMQLFKNLLQVNIEYELDYERKNCASFASSMFSYILENMFLKYAPKGMFITTRPANVINEIPFQIDKSVPF
uniref:Protein kinase domain-containing protein n=1 Tax=viral metagenome TaxID=1070528 RepID=A0A6C0LNY6_9ZZZZ